MNSLKILFVCNYYTPYVSGLTEHVRMVAEGIAQRGHEVTVLTSNHAKLPKEDVVNGVRVVRAPIICKISKGTVSPAIITLAKKLSKKADIVNLHLPMLESGVIAQLVPKEKLYITYHCDMCLPDGLINKFIVGTLNVSHKMALKRSKRIISNTTDYLLSSNTASPFKSKFVEIPPPINVPSPSNTPSGFLDEFNGRIKIGFCGRIVAEKGLKVLIKAFREIKEKIPDAVLLIAGDYSNVAGGSIYPELIAYIEKNNISDIHFLGKVPDDRMHEFYSSLNVFVLPSTQALESFGLVQVEAMMCGTPVVASNLIGVRSIVDKTKMGLISARGDHRHLAHCLFNVVTNKDMYIKSTDFIKTIYGTNITIDKYLQLFMEE